MDFASKPPIWSYLFSMDNWHTKTPPSFPQSVESDGKKPHRKFRKAADAIALIAAREQDAQCVSACAIEVYDNARFNVRIAQNGKISLLDLNSLNKILASAAAAVDAKDAVEWKQMQKDAKTDAKTALAKTTVLPMVIENCRGKIGAVLSLARKVPISLASWLQEADLSLIDEDIRDLIRSCFTVICGSGGQDDLLQ
ncbi:hypothetical protein B0H10DRAFT_2196685, partial [Mycena sp. CBHHK59/15]